MNIYDLKSIETPRLLIRPVRLGDEKSINAAINRSLDSLQRWMPWAKDPSLETTLEFVTKADRGWRSGKSHDFPMVAIHKQDQCIVAATGYNEKSDPALGVYEIGYWIDENYQGRGLASEFVNALTQFALLALNANRVQVSTQAENKRSIALVERLGFKLEDILKNNCIDSLSNQPADSLLYVCCDADTLPKLDVNWTD